MIDYGQFYVCEDPQSLDEGNVAVRRSDMLTGVWTGKNYLAIYTPRRHGLATVTVEVSSEAPLLDLSQWDNVLETSLHIRSGTLVADSWDPAEGKSVQVAVTPAVYRVRVLGSGFDQAAATEDGDNYVLQLWPDTAAPPRSIKAWNGFSRIFGEQ